VRTIDDINRDLRDLWGKFFFRDGEVYAPMQYEMPKPGALVFVGMNPSFSTTGWKSILRRSEVRDLNPHDFFRWPSPQDFNIELAHTLEALAHEHYSFFAPHRYLAKALGVSWVHFDLFAYRATKQSKMQTLAFVRGNEIKLTDFGAAQFSLFQELLILARPSAVVVINALASQVYLKMRPLKFNSSVGYYCDPLEQGLNVPVFLSGMLTGARALDRFSRDRLFWQISRALGKTWQPRAGRMVTP